jgi:hypothetical protein
MDLHGLGAAVRKPGAHRTGSGLPGGNPLLSPTVSPSLGLPSKTVADTHGNASRASSASFRSSRFGGKSRSLSHLHAETQGTVLAHVGGDTLVAVVDSVPDEDEELLAERLAAALG